MGNFELFFNASGVKLDSRNCEALEEVFRRVRTKTLDLENTGLEDDVSTAWVEINSGFFMIHVSTLMHQWESETPK